MSVAQNLMKHLLHFLITEGVPENGFRIQEIIENGRNLGLTEEEAQDAIRKLKHQGSVYEPRPGFLLPLNFEFPGEVEKEKEEKKRNYWEKNGYIHFSIEKVIMTLHDLIETPLHGDGEDRVFERQIEIKTTLFSVFNFVREQNKTYKSAGQAVFYRTNHEELLRTNGSYIIVVYSLNENSINIHAQKQIPAKDIDPLIKKSMSKEKIGIRWTRFFKEVSEEPIFQIPKEEFP